MDGNRQGATHQGHHHQSATKSQHAGRPTSDTAHPGQPRHRGRHLIGGVVRRGSFTHAERQHDIEHRLHRQQHPTGGSIGQPTEQQRRSKGRHPDPRRWSQGDAATAQMNDGAS